MRFTITDWIHNLIRGAANVLDIGGTLCPELTSQSDANAIRSDWEAVGGDLWTAIRENNKSFMPMTK